MLPGFLRVDEHSGSVRSFQPNAGANPLNLGYGLTIAVATTILRIPSDCIAIWVMMHVR